MKFINNLTLGLVIICFVSLAVSQDCLGDCEKFALNLESEIVSQNDQQAIRDADGKLIKSECAPREEPIVGAPSKISTNDEDLLQLLKEVMVGVNDVEDPDYEFVEVTGVSRQVVSGIAYKINATLKSENTPVKCHISIWEQVWLENGREVKMHCDNEKKYKFKQQPTRRSDRKKRDAPLLGAPLDASNDDEETKLLLTNNLKKLETGDAGELTLIEVHKVTKQVVAGTLYKIKGLFRQGNDKTTSCTVKIWSRPWLSEEKAQQVEANCDEGAKYKSVQREKRSSRPYLHHHKHSIESEINAYVKEEKSEKMFKNFITKHERKYGDDIEKSMRFRIFKKNLHKIEQLNRHEQGTAKYGITEFSDMTGKEYLHKTGLSRRQRHENELKNPIADIPDVPVPEAFDWRDKGAVTDVKNQANCGSCWAFSVTGNIEGVHAVKTGKLESYSEQELLDCDTVDNACNGGLPDDAYKAIETIGGLELEDDYPYEAKKAKQCKFNQTMSHVKVKGAVDLPKDEVSMQKWLITNGPISIGINAAAMQFYRGGVSHPWKVLCRKSDLDHGVLIVGFGKKEYPMFNKTLPYWIVKNSWGPKWGEQGYYRVYRGDNTCGVSEMASSAILE